MALSLAARRGRCSSISEKVPWKLRVHIRAYTMMLQNCITLQETSALTLGHGFGSC
jgi:hypothetical protein